MIQLLGFPDDSDVKNLLVMQETHVPSPGWEDALEREGRKGKREGRREEGNHNGGTRICDAFELWGWRRL